MRVMQCGHARCAPMGARGFPHRGHGHGAKEEMCVEREETPILYKRVLLYSHFRSRPVWGRGCPRQRLRPPSSCRPPGPRSCQLARCPRTLPLTTSTASLPVLARRFRADLREVGRFEGIGPDLWELGAASTRASVGREPVTAEDCGSDCGVSNWARTPTGF